MRTVLRILIMVLLLRQRMLLLQLEQYVCDCINDCDFGAAGNSDFKSVVGLVLELVILAVVLMISDATCYLVDSRGKVWVHSCNICTSKVKTSAPCSFSFL